LNLWGYIQKLMGGWAKLMSYLTAGDLKASWLRDAEAYKANAETAFGASQEMMDRSMASFEGMLAKSTELAAAQSGLKQQIREEEAAAQAEADLGEMETQQQKLARLASYYAVTQEMAAEAAAIEEESLADKLARHASYYNATAQMAAKLAKYNDYAAKKELKLEQRNAQSRLQIATSLGQAMLAFAGVNSKQIFLITKAFQVGTAIAAAYTAYAMALAHPPGPPTTIPIAKAALASGLWAAAGVAATALASFATSSMAGDVGSMATATGAPYVAQETPSFEPEEEEEEKAERSIKVDFHIYGNVVDHDKFARELTPALQKALADGA